MSDLDWLFDVGPQLKWMFWKSGDPIRFEIAESRGCSGVFRFGVAIVVRPAPPHGSRLVAYESDKSLGQQSWRGVGACWFVREEILLWERASHHPLAAAQVERVLPILEWAEATRYHHHHRRSHNHQCHYYCLCWK